VINNCPVNLPHDPTFRAISGMAIGFALRLAFAGHTAIPRESEIDFLTEAEAAFAPPQPKKTATKKARQRRPIEAAAKTAAKKTTTKNQVAA
jgi:ParB family transcriptional regulator, chromosome partitioning protein